MIVTVTPNPALDLTWHVAHVETGGSHRVETGRSRGGGKGVNVARVASALGADVLAVLTAGGATGSELLAELDASGLRYRAVPVAGATRRSVAIVDESLGDTTIFNERGEPLSGDEWGALRSAVGDALPGADVLVISGSLPPGAPDDLVPSLVAAARAQGVAVVVDTSGPALLAAADAGADVVKPNRAELAEATGLDDPIAGARVLLARGAGLVLCSLGADGLIAIGGLGAEDSAAWSTGALGADGEPAGSDADAGVRKEDAPVRAVATALRARLPEPLAGNPTGAGDAAVAAVATLLARGERDTATLLRAAASWSAAAVLMPLAGEISPRHPELAAQLVVDQVLDPSASGTATRASTPAPAGPDALTRPHPDTTPEPHRSEPR